MSISAEEKNRYLRETAIVLAREGFHTDRTHTGGLRVLLDGAPLCEVTENGGITYRNEDIDEPERIDAKDKVYEIVRTTAEYMRQMETAPFLKADGLEDGYKVLADFNGIVLAGIQSKYGAQFVTWDWSFDRKGVCHGHYYTGLYSSGNYDAAKRDFAVRSGLIPKQQLFQEEQLIEIYRCCTDTLQGGFELSYDQEKTIQEVRKQIEECLPDIMERTLYRRCTWTRNGEKRIVWRCVSRLDYGKKYCHNSPTLDEAPLQQAILAALNTAMADKNSLIRQITDAMETEIIPFPGGTMSLGDIERRLRELEQQFQTLLEKATDDPAAYGGQFKEILDEQTFLKEKRSGILADNNEQAKANQRIQDAAQTLENASPHITEWDESAVRQLVETVKVLSKDEIAITLKGGIEICQKIMY